MKINQLTFFRFVAAVCVVIFHFGRDLAPFNSPTTLLFVNHFNALVSFFFLLSGFVLAVSSFKKPQIDKKVFYINRLTRIYPLYLVAMMIYLIPVILSGNWQQMVQWKPLAHNLTLTQALFSDNALTLNYPGWSLSAELCFYLLFPMLFSFLYKRSSKFVMISGLLFWMATMTMYALSIEKFEVPGNYTMYFPGYHLSTFVFGVAGGLLFCRHKEMFERAKLWLSLSTLALLAGSVALILIPNPVEKYYHSGLFNPFFMSLVWLFAIDRAPFKKILSSQPLVKLGEISYGIYILQYSMWCFFYYVAGVFNLPALYNFYVALAGLIVSSVVMYHAVEMPAVNLMKAMLGRKKPVPAEIILLPAGYGFNPTLAQVSRK